MKRALSFIFGWCLIIVSVVVSIQCTALDENFYLSRYEKMDLAYDIGTNSHDLNQSIVVLLDYLKDQRDDMDLEITWNDHEQLAFNEKEKAHMVDVKTLYQNAILIAKVSFILLILIGLYFFIFDRKLMWAYLSKGFLISFVCLLVALAFFGFWILTDFTSFWTWFHTIFFSNQLWLLDPSTDFMICMLPETIFYQIVIWCAIKVVCFLLLVVFVSVYYIWKKAPIGFEVKA